MLGTQDERGVLTVISQENGLGRFMGGYYGKLGPGVLGAAADYGQSAGDSLSTASTPYKDNAGNTVSTKSTTDSFAKVNAWDVALSYGVPVNDGLSLGGGVFIAHTGQHYSVDPTTMTVGGISTFTDPSGDSNNTSAHGTLSALDQTFTGVVGVALTSDTHIISLNGVITQATASNSVDAGYNDGNTTFTATGFMPGTSLGQNRSGVSGGLLADTHFTLSDVTALRVQADLGLGGGGPKDANSIQKSVTSGGGSTTTITSTDAYKSGAKYGDNIVDVLGALELGFDGSTCARACA